MHTADCKRCGSYRTQAANYRHSEAGSIRNGADEFGAHCQSVVSRLGAAALSAADYLLLDSTRRIGMLQKSKN
jgi:hypothetical protein